MWVDDCVLIASQKYPAIVADRLGKMFCIIWFKSMFQQFPAERLILAICNQGMANKPAVLV